jgi:hypothetical protein
VLALRETASDTPSQIVRILHAAGTLEKYQYRAMQFVAKGGWCMSHNRRVINTAEDEYTPEQRRIIDARLEESKDDFKEGRTYGPFETAAAMIDFLHSHVLQVRPDVAHAPRVPRRHSCRLRAG